MNEEDKVIEEAREALKAATEAFNKANEAKEALRNAEADCSVAALKLELLANSMEENEHIVKLMDDMDFYRSLITYILDNWPTLEKKGEQ